MSPPTGTSDRRGRRVALPEEFLRVPGWSGGGPIGDPQVAADARLAMMLQVGRFFGRSCFFRLEFSRRCGPGLIFVVVFIGGFSDGVVATGWAD